MRRRWLPKLCVFLLLGAILSIAIAWLCASRSDMYWPYWEGTGFCSSNSPSPEARQWLGPTVWDPERIETRGVGFGAECAMWRADPFQPIPQVDELRCGLPTLCLKGESFSSKPGAAAWRSGLLGTGDPEGPPSLRPMPCRPIWTGLAINTLFYAAACWSLHAAARSLPRVLRQRGRIARGLCPACAYPVGSSDVCTECGTPRPVAARPARGEGM